MAQSEDTELRDLVVEALEKNGSLAKIRALLRANVFLAFEDGYDSLLQNMPLDNILKTPEGLLSLSVVHEFLEFCNLKNTLFVYKSETRQEKAYKYVGSKVLHENFDFKYDSTKEPVLISMVKYIKKSLQRIYTDRNTTHHSLKKEKNINSRDDQNCTYIVHDDSSSTTSHTNSDNSSDEKTKLQRRLHSDNSDTDTSSDSARDKSSSEYIPNEHLLQIDKQNSLHHKIDKTASENQLKVEPSKIIEIPSTFYLRDLKNHQNTSSESTSYVDLKPFNALEEKSLNTMGIPTIQNITNEESSHISNDTGTDKDRSRISKEIKSPPSNTLSSVSSLSVKKEVRTQNENQHEKKSFELSLKSDSETVEYSYDFTMSGASKKKDNDLQATSPRSIEEQIASLGSHSKNSSLDSPHENSASSRSSISISDVQDLISEKSLSIGKNLDDDSNDRLNIQKCNKSSDIVKSPSNDSGDFSESPIPSLSNLSLDIHSD